MLPGTKDNILDLLKYIEQQNLPYILAIWPPQQNNKNKDSIVIYTSFEKNELKKINSAIQIGEIVSK